jgi:hypothetical protein
MKAHAKNRNHFIPKMGMTIITGEQDSFTATKERFWSQRFTKEKLLNYFKFCCA